MRFEKGQSGNVSGRPRKTEEQRKFERRCQEWADTLGFDKLKRWADMDDFDKSFPALKEIFNRGFGTAVATQIIDAEIAAPTGSSTEDLAGELGGLIPRAKAESGGLDNPDQVESGI